MSKNEAIDIFLRVRPTSEPFKGFSNNLFYIRNNSGRKQSLIRT
jgi:hypothetical protein